MGLSDDELSLAESIDTSTTAILEHNLKLATVRQVRMMRIIEELKAAGPMTTVKAKRKYVEAPNEAPEGGEVATPATGEEGGPELIISKVVEVEEAQEGTLGQIMAMEGAMNQLYGQITRMVEARTRDLIRQKNESEHAAGSGEVIIRVVRE